MRYLQGMQSIRVLSFSYSRHTNSHTQPSPRPSWQQKKNSHILYYNDHTEHTEKKAFIIKNMKFYFINL
jgi:hypothetical protein